MYHILYNSFEETPHGRDYIGAHSTENLYDGYLGSYSDKTFKPTARIIIAFYPDRESLLKAEREFQRMLKVVEDPQYANKAYQTSTGFSVQGLKQPSRIRKYKDWRRRRSRRPTNLKLETTEKMSVKKQGENNPMYGRSGELSPTYGRIKTQEEIESRREKMKQKRWFVNSDGETRMLDTLPPKDWRPGRVWEEN